MPSPKLWREYAKFQESKHGKLEQINFRAKEEGWKKFGMKENHLYIPREKDPFMNMFLDDFCLRPSCYKCRAKKYRLSDISIADFWGIEKVTPEMNDGLENVRVTDKKTAQNDPAVQEAVKAVAEALGDTGRILVRESGTEPVVRVMVEASDHDTCQKYVSQVVEVIKSRGYAV